MLNVCVCCNQIALKGTANKVTWLDLMFRKGNTLSVCICDKLRQTCQSHDRKGWSELHFYWSVLQKQLLHKRKFPRIPSCSSHPADVEMLIQAAWVQIWMKTENIPKQTKATCYVREMKCNPPLVSHLNRILWHILIRLGLHTKHCCSLNSQS